VRVENSPPARAWLFASIKEIVNRLPTIKSVSAAGMSITMKNALRQKETAGSMVAKRTPAAW
jgi:hypothetical protein